MRRLLVLLAITTELHAQSTGWRVVALRAPDATLSAEFTLVTSVRELADGRVLVIDASDKKLLVGNWSNRTVAQISRNGSGPGEYAQPALLLALTADSTLLSDPRNGRWLVLHGSSIVATLGPDTPALRSGARIPVGADSHGRVIFTRPIGARSGAPNAEPRRDSLVLVRVARATGQLDTVATLRARPSTIKIEGATEKPTAVSVFINPLAAGEIATLFPDGWIAIARLDPYRVDWIAADGRRIRGAPLPFERVRLDEREQRAFVERLAARSGNPPRDPASFPEWPVYMPPFLYESLLPAPDGRLWVRRPPTAANPNPPYDVVDRRGALVARVAIEKDVTVVGFGRDVVYTAVTDENGIQRVRRSPLPRL
ncbi:MAG TPA: 6-bladed beta-propeller [Gemmatimonadaceae bacterium]|nr:6-bladed beta-propeller [Gemmatimonadaceae bacterium]